MRTTRIAPCLLAVLGVLATAGCSKDEPVAEPVRAVRTMKVTAGQSGGTTEYAGEVRARIESRLGFRIGGKVLRRNVNVGDAVRAGQVLASLDPQDARLGQDSARAALAAADVNLAQARADFERFRELKNQGFISEAELERRQTTLKAAQAGHDQARAQWAMQGNQTGYATLTADAPGVVTAIEAEAGAVVAAGATVIRLAQDGPRDVVFSVPEDRLEAFRAAATRPGALRVKLWGSGQTLPAHVREVSAAADATTRTLQVKAELANGARVTLGQTASVLLDLPAVSRVTRLPLSAVAQVQGQTVVWVLDAASMTVKPQPVQVSGADGNSVVVAAEPAVGQEVVTAGVHTLAPGQKVKRYVEPGSAAPEAALPAVPGAPASGAATR